MQDKYQSERERLGCGGCLWQSTFTAMSLYALIGGAFALSAALAHKPAPAWTIPALVIAVIFGLIIVALGVANFLDLVYGKED